jgi:hypothetical protein
LKRVDFRVASNSVLRRGAFAERRPAEEILNNDSEIDLFASFVGVWFEGLREISGSFLAVVQTDVWIGR